MANALKGWLANNTVTADSKDSNDKILVLKSTGKADMKKCLLKIPTCDRKH